MIPTRSARVAASSMSWVVSTMVTPLALRSATRSQTNRRAAGSSPVVGSSRNSTWGACISDRSRLLRWGTTATSRRARTGSAPTSTPPTPATPPVRRTRVVRIPTVVVLPAPLGPSSPNTSPEELHEALRRRAVEEGMSLADYVLDLIRRDLGLPSRREWFERRH
jgi:hypothetical protein